MQRILIAVLLVLSTMATQKEQVDWAAQSGRPIWDVPLGSLTELLTDELAAKVRPHWGSPNLGGPMITGGGLVFIAAALDRLLHAYDIDSGRELWRGSLPNSGKATPMSYRLSSGEQYVAVTVGGGGPWGPGDYVVAFRLSR